MSKSKYLIITLMLLLILGVTTKALPIATTTTLQSIPNPSTVGELVTFTATVDPSTATGWVRFYDSTAFKYTAVLSGGIATYSTTTLTARTHKMTARYSGDSTVPYDPSRSDTVLQVVNGPLSTTTAITSTPNPSLYSGSVTFTATVTPNPGVGHGTIQFYADGSTLGSTIALDVDGKASYITSPGELAEDDHPIYAYYSGYTGTTSYSASTSPTLTQYVYSSLPAASTTVLNSNYNPSQHNQLVTFTATVTPDIATGNVEFLDGLTSLGIVSLIDGTASFSTNGLTAGSHPITAHYEGDVNFNGSTSDIVNQVVNPDSGSTSTWTTLISDINPSLLGVSVTFTATVTPNTATGYVEFRDGGTPLVPQIALSNGIALYPTDQLAEGSHQITAHYLGDLPNHNPSNSSVLNQVVYDPNNLPLITTTTVGSYSNPSQIGWSVTFHATVDPNPGNGHGTVQFSIDGFPFDTPQLLNAQGKAFISTGSLTLGPHTITAQYSGYMIGLPTYASSTSDEYVQQVTYPTSDSFVACIQGKKFWDQDGDGEYDDPGEPGLAGWTIMVNPGQRYVLTDNNGDYIIPYLPTNTYTVSEIIKPNWIQTYPLTGTHTVEITSPSQVVTDINFGNNTINNTTQDLSVSIAGGIARPGFNKLYSIQYENKGTMPVSGTIIITIPSEVTYISNGPIAGTYNEVPVKTVTWDVGTLQPGFIGWLWVFVNIPSTLPLGTQLTSSVEITPSAPDDINPSDNTDSETQTVRGSYDPNEKLVTPEGEIATDQTLRYHINFQNVGTDTAFNIIVKDTLDEDLDETTVTFGATSHPCSFIQDGRVLIWTFNDINLEDSTSNEPASHGFAEFTVLPLTSLAPGTEITNNAGVYFDYNLPVITNTVYNNIEDLSTPGWAMKESIITPHTNDIIKDGGALVGVPGSGKDVSKLFAFLGTKTNRVKIYTIGTGWSETQGDSMIFGHKYKPATQEINLEKYAKKFPGKGASMCFDGNHTIYATKGNGTCEFYAYDLLSDAGWTAKAFVPTLKPLKGGTSIRWYDGKVYLLAGGQKVDAPTNFYSYDPSADTVNGTPWTPLTKVTLTDGKIYKDGSSIVELGGTIYAIHGGAKATNPLYAYDWETGTWLPKTPIPIEDSSYHKYKKKLLVKDGACTTTDGSVIYANKGGGTEPFWKYTPGTPGVWERLDRIPIEKIDKKHAPKTGAAMAYADGCVWLLVGNKQPDFWQYVPEVKSNLKAQNSKVTQSVIASESEAISNLTSLFSVNPNPFTKLTTVRYNVPTSGKVSIKLYNASGRLIEILVNDNLNAGVYTVTLSTKTLAKGIYFLRYNDNTNQKEIKLIVE